MESLKGRLLLAAGDLLDPGFRQTVVLLGEHDEEGAVGVVLNRTLDFTVGDAVPALAPLAGPDARLHQGGPVEPEQAVLLVETTDPDLLNVPVAGAIGFMTGDVPAEIHRQVRRARIFVGHSGWGPGQLESEMEAESWIVADPTPDDIFTPDPDRLWRRVLERKGPPYSGLARIPFDPSTN